MLYLPRFCNFIDTIAILTTDASVFGPLSVGDKSLGVETLVKNKDMALSKSGAYHTKLYRSLCWTFGGDPSSRLVRGFPVTTKMRGKCDYYSKVHSQCHGQVRQLLPSHRRERGSYHNQMLAVWFTLRSSVLWLKTEHQYLPQRYSPIRDEEDHGTLKSQRRPRPFNENPSLL